MFLKLQNSTATCPPKTIRDIFPPVWSPKTWFGHPCWKRFLSGTPCISTGTTPQKLFSSEFTPSFRVTRNEQMRKTFALQTSFKVQLLIFRKCKDMNSKDLNFLTPTRGFLAQNLCLKRPLPGEKDLQMDTGFHSRSTFPL